MVCLLSLQSLSTGVLEMFFFLAGLPVSGGNLCMVRSSPQRNGNVSLFPEYFVPFAVPLSVWFLARGAFCPMCHMLEPSRLPAYNHKITVNNNNVNILNLQNKRHRD